MDKKIGYKVLWDESTPWSRNLRSVSSGILSYDYDTVTRRKVWAGPLTVFESIDAVTSFMHNYYTGHRNLVIAECECEPSSDRAVWYDETGAYITIESLSVGTVLAK